MTSNELDADIAGLTRILTLSLPVLDGWLAGFIIKINLPNFSKNLELKILFSNTEPVVQT